MSRRTSRMARRGVTTKIDLATETPEGTSEFSAPCFSGVSLRMLQEGVDEATERPVLVRRNAEEFFDQLSPRIEHPGGRKDFELSQPIQVLQSRRRHRVLHLQFLCGLAHFGFRP